MPGRRLRDSGCQSSCLLGPQQKEGHGFVVVPRLVLGLWGGGGHGAAEGEHISVGCYPRGGLHRQDRGGESGGELGGLWRKRGEKVLASCLCGFSCVSALGVKTTVMQR